MSPRNVAVRMGGIKNRPLTRYAKYSRGTEKSKTILFSTDFIYIIIY
jgi:hypothetical protein